MNCTLKVAALLVALGAGRAPAQTATLRPGSPEDPKLRADAVRLLERANAVSTPAVWPPNEMRLRFRLGDPPAGFPTEGEYVSSVGGPGLRRQQWNYGGFQATQIRNGQRIKMEHPNNVPMPAILNLLTELAPIYLVRFDNHDIIRTVTSPSEGIRCIDFETVTGERAQSNQVCVHEKNGWVQSIRIGDLITKYSDFFPLAQSFLPGHTERWRGSQLLIAVDETVTAKSDYPADYFEVPENTNASVCQDFRRAFEVSTPQPEPRSASIEVTDIRLNGLIGMNGRVSGLKPVDTTHPELNEEAMHLVSTWTYVPAQCGGQPVTWQTIFTVHFKGR